MQGEGGTIIVPHPHTPTHTPTHPHSHTNTPDPTRPASVSPLFAVCCSPSALLAASSCRVVSCDGSRDGSPPSTRVLVGGGLSSRWLLGRGERCDAFVWFVWFVVVVVVGVVEVVAVCVCVLCGMCVCCVFVLCVLFVCVGCVVVYVVVECVDVS